MIPYWTVLQVEVGPLTVRTFGLFVGAGIALGLTIVARFARRRALDVDALTSLGIRMVVAGVVGARAAYVVDNWATIRREPWKVFAVWEGGLQFFGGFAAAVVVLLVWFRQNPAMPRRPVGDIFAVALAAGMAVGRLGCVAVGEHLGAESTFGFVFRGGDTIEPVAVGTVLHLPALYEAAALAVIALVGVRALRRPAAEGSVLTGTLLALAGTRFALDFVRVNDERLGGLTASQIACLAVGGGALVLLQRSRTERLAAA